MSASDPGFKAAFEEAQAGAKEGGVPIGACLVDKNGKVLGRGHNMRVQKGSATLHVCTSLAILSSNQSFRSTFQFQHYAFLMVLQAEISALEAAGRLPPSAYKGSTMYTSLSPCIMCTGACLLYGISRVVLGENKTFLGGEELLRSRGVEVINVESKECEDLMSNFIREHPEDWYEDIGEDG